MLRDRAPESEDIPPEPCPYAHGRPESTETAASPSRERENALVFRAHNTKISIKAAFCAAKGIVSPNHRAHNEEHFTTSQQQPPAQEWPKMGRNNGQHQLSSPRTAYIGPEQWTTPTLKPKNGLNRAGAMDHTNSQAQEWPKMGQNNGSNRLSSPRTAYIGPELWITPTLKPKNGLYRAGTMDHTNSQAQERPKMGRNNGPNRLSSPRTAYIGPENKREAERRQH